MKPAKKKSQPCLKKKNNLLVLFVLVWITSSFTTLAGPKQIARNAGGKSPFDLSYVQYELDNGLTVVIHEDHSDPMVYVDVTYHVGSNRESLGRSGFAHFFEHMMFQGSDHVADEEHFKLVTSAGGNMNGSTNMDRTNYFQTLPANQLEMALWLEADRMGFLLDAVTQKKFEVQRSTVKNERGQRYDNRPYGLVYEKTLQALYPQGHPYSWPTIGYLEDLDRVDVNDLKRFFLRWYGPNNATLTVTGDVNPKVVLNLAEKYFGSIPRGPEVADMPKAPAILSEDRFVTHEDKVNAPMLSITWPTVPVNHPDEAALDALATILGENGNKTSVLYKEFVKSQTAYNAYMGHVSKELAGEMNLIIIGFPGKSLRDSYAYWKELLAKLDNTLFTEAEVEAYKAKTESALLQALASINGKGRLMASNQTFMKNPNGLFEQVQRINSLRTEDLKRVFRQYLLEKNAVYVSVVPAGKADDAASISNYAWLPPKPDEEQAQYKNLKYIKPVDSFDRSVKPAAPQLRSYELPKIQRTGYSNGLSIIHAKNDEVPLISMDLKIMGGHLLDSLRKSGTASLLAELFMESTHQHSGEQNEQRLSSWGSEITAEAEDNCIVFHISSTQKYFDSTMAVLREILLTPAILEDEFDRVLKRKLQTISQVNNQASAVANKCFMRTIYGDQHPLGWPVIGTAQSVGRNTVEDVRNFYLTFISPSAAKLAIVSPGKLDDLARGLSFLREWKGPQVNIPAEPPCRTMDSTVVYFYNKTKAEQSEIRIGYVAMPFDATETFYKSMIMNYPLGGNFNSRINLNLREDKGYTYGARSGFSGNQLRGPFMANAAVRASATDSALVEFMKEINLFATQGMRQDELDFTKSALGQADALKYETPAQKAGFIMRILDYNLPDDFTSKQKTLLKKIRKEELNELAKEKLPFSKMAIVIVGDKNLLMERILALGYKIVDIDQDGRPFSSKALDPR